MFRMFRPLSSAFRDWALFAAGQGRDIVELPGFSGVSWILFLMLSLHRLHLSAIFIYIPQSQIHPFNAKSRLNSRCWNQFLRGNATEDVSPSWISRTVILRILSQAIHQHLFEVDPMLSTNIFNLGPAELKKAGV